jgi:Na+-driven multidrug efflux pump
MIIWMLCVPIFFLWFFGTRSVLAVLGIDEAQAELAQQFTRIQCLWMLPVFMNRTIQTYWRAFRVVKPYKNATIIGFIFHVPVCYAMTFQVTALAHTPWTVPCAPHLGFCAYSCRTGA